MTERFDRRGAMGLIAGGAALSTLPGSTFAQQRPLSDRKLGYAIVGLGNYATNQIMPRFKECRHSKLVALVSGTPAKLERYGAEYGVPVGNRYSYADYDRIADNPAIDIVYVVLPVSMHAEYSIRASRAGKHVMCEKPMAMSSAECSAMIAAAKRANRKLMIGYRCHFEPVNRLAIDLARSSHVGRTRIITAEHGFNAQPNQWRLDRSMSGGGSMMDIGIYSLNAARYLAGEEPISVTATESTDRRDPRFATVEDRISFLLAFPSGAIANCVSSYTSGHNRYRVVGEDGWFDAESATGYSGNRLMVRRDGRTADRTPAEKSEVQFARQLDHLSECVMTGREPIVSGEEGLRDIRLIEAIYRSAKEGRTIKV